MLIYVGILREHNCLITIMHILSKLYCISVFYLFIFNTIRNNHCKAPENNYFDGVLYKK